MLLTWDDRSCNVGGDGLEGCVQNGPRTMDYSVVMNFDSAFRGKRVLVTGHTGFKGSWLTSWLLLMGAEVCGVALDPPTEPSMFAILGLEKRCRHHVLDIRNSSGLSKIVSDFAPDYLFHLAAQAIVSRSYADPVDTISTNVVGTANVLEALRPLTKRCVAVMITSDKCYENVEWVWGYRESDALGGKDIYSASKAAAEAVIHAYHHSYFSDAEGPIRLARARAGNVIGGGDWAADRIVADCMRAWNRNDTVAIRCPRATRPWQHVLEPLGGYLALAVALSKRPELQGEAFNFGPLAEQNRTVNELLTTISSQWGFISPDQAFRVVEDRPFSESHLLKLNCDKARHMLGWHAKWDYSDCVRELVAWYKAFYQGDQDMVEITRAQINAYCA